MADSLPEKTDLPNVPEPPLEDEALAVKDAEGQLLRWACLKDVESLLAGAGHAMEPLQPPAQGFMAEVGGVSYTAALVSPDEKRPGCFGGIQLSAFAPLPKALSLSVAAQLALDLPGARLGIDKDGDLALMQTIVVAGGVTRANIDIQFGFWLQNLERVRRAVMRRVVSGPGVVLH
jgi:hypothetical protein